MKKMNTSEILRYVKEHPSGKVKIAYSDIDGILRGKYLATEKFLSAAEKGTSFFEDQVAWEGVLAANEWNLTRDALTREEMTMELLRIWGERPKTVIFVTHDVQEALDIVDYVYYLSEGVMVAHGTPEEMRASKDPLVHQFVWGEADGPVAYQYPSKRFDEELELV